MKSYSFKDSKKDKAGRKTTITITTENPEVIKKLVESTTSNSNSKTSQNKKKKDSMKAEVKEAKKQSPKREPQLLNAPKPSSQDKTLKQYNCEDESLKGRLVIYAPNKDKALKLIFELNKIMSTNYKLNPSIKGRKVTKQVHGLTVDNYYQKQVEQAKTLIARWKKENKKPFEGLRRN